MTDMVNIRLDGVVFGWVSLSKLISDLLDGFAQPH
jgi:hypothetical protein